MKILAVSDNHLQTKELEEICMAVGDTVSLRVHCGDSELSTKDRVLQPFICVRGNNDQPPFREEQLVQAGDHMVLVIHGHKQHVRYNTTNVLQGTHELANYAKSIGATIVFYGHTHVAEAHRDGDVLLINPGSTNFSRGSYRAGTYAIVACAGGETTVTFYDAKTHQDVTSHLQVTL